MSNDNFLAKFSMYFSHTAFEASDAKLISYFAEGYLFSKFS
jgi:hypothetical protein